MEEGHAEDPDELFCDFEAVKDLVEKDKREDSFEFNDDCEASLTQKRSLKVVKSAYGIDCYLF